MNHDPSLKRRCIHRAVERFCSTFSNPHMEITTNDTHTHIHIHSSKLTDIPKQYQTFIIKMHQNIHKTLGIQNTHPTLPMLQTLSHVLLYLLCLAVRFLSLSLSLFLSPLFLSASSNTETFPLMSAHRKWGFQTSSCSLPFTLQGSFNLSEYIRKMHLQLF